ncbi:MAG TPA: RNA-binding domain-containing protein [Candidatus Thermoplasmatota archaeon]|nr:RNA-binding domain-containing protein [Candidatus Thermoplasmatota archaeon]
MAEGTLAAPVPDFHYVALRAFAHATEDPEKVRAALATLLGDAAVTQTAVEGSHGNPILILEATAERTADIKAFWRRVSDSGLAPRLVEEIDRRLDDEGLFFVRFSKQAAALGRIELSQDDDAIQARAKPRSYPASRQGARKVLEATLAARPV